MEMPADGLNNGVMRALHEALVLPRDHIGVAARSVLKNGPGFWGYGLARRRFLL